MKLSLLVLQRNTHLNYELVLINHKERIFWRFPRAGSPAPTAGRATPSAGSAAPRAGSAKSLGNTLCLTPYNSRIKVILTPYIGTPGGVALILAGHANLGSWWCCITQYSAML